MSKESPVPIYYEGQDTSWQSPIKVLPREECHAFKAAGRGKFIDHGRAFRLFKRDPASVLLDQPQPDPKDTARHGDGRGPESVCVQEQTMNDYVAEFRRAREIVKAYHPREFIGPLLRSEALA